MSYTIKNLREVEDSAAGRGIGDFGQARFARQPLEAERTGLAYMSINPGKRQPFGHRHNEAEEIYVVLGGSGRVKLDDEIVELHALDALRVAPDVWRSFEAGSDGLELLALGAHHENDGKMDQEFWTD